MTSAECLKKLHKIRDVAFATVDAAGMPQVRIIDIMLSDEFGLYFLTARGKNFHRELAAEGHAAITGMDRNWMMIRLNGLVRRLDDRAWIDRMFDANQGMNEVYPGRTRDILDPFAVYAGEGEWFSLAKAPIERGSFSFGGAVSPDRGYRITGGCIECGSCAANCPESCITEGSPFVIASRNCVRCGAFREHCPAGAVEKLDA